MALKWPPMSTAQGAGRKANRTATTITMSSSLSRNGPPRDLAGFGEDFFLGLMAASAARIPDTLRRADQPNLPGSWAAPHRKTRILPWQTDQEREPPMSVLSDL